MILLIRGILREHDRPIPVTTAAFMPDLSTSAHGILGRRGFFDQFTFQKFRDHDNELEIGKKRR
jgi:hypothetical protein